MAKLGWCGTAAFFVCTGIAHGAHATSFYVTDTADSYTQGDGKCSLREAVDAANYDDCWTDCGCGEYYNEDEVYLTPGATYTLTTTLEVWDWMVLAGLGGTATIQGSSGGGDFAGIQIDWQSWDVQINNITLTNFRHSALYMNDGSYAEASNVEIRNNPFDIGSGQNASILVGQSAYLFLTQANIHDNPAAIKGGGLFINPSGYVTLDSSVIAYNTATQYGGGVIVQSQGTLNCTGGSIIYSNSAGLNGGGLYKVPGSTVTGYCSIYGNTVDPSLNPGSGGGKKHTNDIAP